MPFELTQIADKSVAELQMMLDQLGKEINRVASKPASMEIEPATNPTSLIMNAKENEMKMALMDKEAWLLDVRMKTREHEKECRLAESQAEKEAKLAVAKAENENLQTRHMIVADELKLEDKKREPKRTISDWFGAKKLTGKSRVIQVYNAEDIDLSIEDDIELLISLRAIMDDLKVKTLVVNGKEYSGLRQIADVMEKEHVMTQKGSSGQTVSTLDECLC